MEEKKKILHIVESFSTGIFSFLVDLVNNTDESFDITIAYGVREETPKDFKKYFSDRVKFIEVKNFERSISFKKDLRALKEVKEIIKNVNPDIIHLHSSKAGFIGRFAANGRKVKMFYNPHGFSFLMKNSSKIKRLIYWWIEKIATLRKCTIVGCSKGEYEEALKLTKKSICINNGINTEKLESETKEIKTKKIELDNLKVCTSGGIRFQKNPELFNQIAEAFPNIQFTWIGDGDLKDKLTSSNIKVTGWLKKEDVLKEVAKNDIFILPSLWEGLPISLLEAMYLEKVCIVSNVIGNRDVIINEENGFVCNELEEYITVISNILSDKYDLDKIRDAAKDNVLNEYNVNKMSQKYEIEYKRVKI